MQAAPCGGPCIVPAWRQFPARACQLHDAFGCRRSSGPAPGTRGGGPGVHRVREITQSSAAPRCRNSRGFRPGPGSALFGLIGSTLSVGVGVAAHWTCLALIAPPSAGTARAGHRQRPGERRAARTLSASPGELISRR